MVKGTMKKKPYIEVAVALPVHGSYLYRAPDHFDGIIRPGMRVLVPFGRRRVTGYMLSRKSDNKGYQIKLILDLLDEEPLFPADIIPFLKWISDYYVHPLGEVIKTALPTGLTRHDEMVVSLTAKGEEQLDKEQFTPGEFELALLLKKKGPRTLKSLKKKNGPASIHGLVKKMARLDLVALSSRLKKERAKMKTETFIRLTPSRPENVKLSKKREQILAAVTKKKEISLQSLKKTIPTAPRLVKLLVLSGYLETTKKQVFRDPLGDAVEPDSPPLLTSEQAGVVRTVTANLTKGFKRYLLSGVTGSGKTEVYMQIVSEAVKKGMGALILVPEISLISQTERRFRARFGNTIAVIHSSLTMGERLDQWQRIALKHLNIVIGVRSSLFAPIDNPGIIIVDEEHDQSYKQETGLKYNARDLAIVRAKFHNIPIVLGSATPSIQSYHNACEGRFQELTLKNRVNRHPLPDITLVDLKKYKDHRWADKLITPELSRAIRHCLDRQEQILIFLNRRGFATFPICESCGSTLKCRSCDLTMTLHLEKESYRCHLCGYRMSSRVTCPTCSTGRIKALGFGTQKIEEMLRMMFPDARTARLDQDTAAKKGATISLLKQIRHQTVDIVVGTQMLAKGHDFPGITLVGVICADLSLNFPDFRSGERTFQLLAQVAGRAGRGKKKGRVIMQTYNPDHFSIEASKNQDYVEFYQKEIPFRRALAYPPFSRIIQLIISGKDKKKSGDHARLVGALLKTFLEEAPKKNNTIQILGPIEAGIPKIALRYRWQILLKSPSSAALNRLVKEMISNKMTTQRGVTVSIDVDPYFMM